MLAHGRRKDRCGEVRAVGRSRPHVVLAGALAAVVLALSGMGYATAFHYGGQINHVNAFEGLTGGRLGPAAPTFWWSGPTTALNSVTSSSGLFMLAPIPDRRAPTRWFLLHLSSDGSIGVVSIPGTPT